MSSTPSINPSDDRVDDINTGTIRLQSYTDYTQMDQEFLCSSNFINSFLKSLPSLHSQQLSLPAEENEGSTYLLRQERALLNT